MKDKQRPEEIPPLLIGRLSRIAFGLGTFVVIGILGFEALGWFGTVILGALGVSFVIGGLAGIPGCEISAIPNIFLPRSRRFHCF